MYDKTKFINVGLDLHKEQHTAVIMDCFNEKLGEITFQNKPSEFSKLVVKAKRFCTDGKGIVFALENSYGYGRALAAWLIERNNAQGARHELDVFFCSKDREDTVKF